MTLTFVTLLILVTMTSRSLHIFARVFILILIVEHVHVFVFLFLVLDGFLDLILEGYINGDTSFSEFKAHFLLLCLYLSAVCQVNHHIDFSHKPPHALAFQLHKKLVNWLNPLYCLFKFFSLIFATEQCAHFQVLFQVPFEHEVVFHG